MVLLTGSMFSIALLVKGQIGDKLINSPLWAYINMLSVFSKETVCQHANFLLISFLNTMHITEDCCCPEV